MKYHKTHKSTEQQNSISGSSETNERGIGFDGLKRHLPNNKRKSLESRRQEIEEHDFEEELKAKRFDRWKETRSEPSQADNQTLKSELEQALESAEAKTFANARVSVLLSNKMYALPWALGSIALLVLANLPMLGAHLIWNALIPAGPVLMILIPVLQSNLKRISEGQNRSRTQLPNVSARAFKARLLLSLAGVTHLIVFANLGPAVENSILLAKSCAASSGLFLFISLGYFIDLGKLFRKHNLFASSKPTQRLDKENWSKFARILATGGLPGALIAWTISMQQYQSTATAGTIANSTGLTIGLIAASTFAYYLLERFAFKKPSRFLSSASAAFCLCVFFSPQIHLAIEASESLGATILSIASIASIAALIPYAIFKAAAKKIDKEKDAPQKSEASLNLHYN